MNKSNKLPRNLRITLWMLRIRAPIDSKRGPDAVQKTVQSVYELMQSCIHRLCKDFIAENHSLLIEASKKVTAYSNPEPMNVDESTSIVKRKAQIAEAAVAANATRENAERTETARSDLSVFIDEHCELIASVISHCSSSVEKYLAKISKRMDVAEIKNPFDGFVFEPVEYHIFKEARRSDETFSQKQKK